MLGGQGSSLRVNRASSERETKTGKSGSLAQYTKSRVSHNRRVPSTTHTDTHFLFASVASFLSSRIHIIIPTPKMARTTRSQKLSDDHPNGLTASHPPPSPSKPKSPTRKRKRESLAHPEDQPATKQPRNGDITNIHTGDEQTKPPTDSVNHTSLHPKGTGDLPLDPHIAQQILDILEMSVPFFRLRQRETHSHHCGVGLTPKVFSIASSPSPLTRLALQVPLTHNHSPSHRVTLSELS